MKNKLGETKNNYERFREETIINQKVTVACFSPCLYYNTVRDFLICLLHFPKYSQAPDVSLKVSLVIYSLIQPPFIVHWPCVKNRASWRKYTHLHPRNILGEKGKWILAITGIGRRTRVILEKGCNQALSREVML